MTHLIRAKKTFSLYALVSLLVILPLPLLAQLRNPLNVGSIEQLLVAILNIVIIIAVPIIVFFIILAGFKYVTARGNAQAVEEANRAITYAVVGGVLILGAVVISEIIQNVVESFRS